MSWSRIRQSTRETFGNKDQRTEIPSDVPNLFLKADGVCSLYETVIEKGLEYFPEVKLKTKNADDPVKGQKLYLVARSFQELGALYQQDVSVKEFFLTTAQTVKELARYKMEMDKEVHELYIDPKRDLIHVRVKKAKDHHEQLKLKRLDLDAKKHKLKQERKSNEESSKIPKYETEVQKAQADFDAEVQAIRQILIPVSNDVDMGREQTGQAAELLMSMKEYHRKCLERLEELDQAIQLRVIRDTAASAKPAQVNPLFQGSSSPTSPSSSNASGVPAGMRSVNHSTPQSPSGTWPRSNGGPPVQMKPVMTQSAPVHTSVMSQSTFQPPTPSPTTSSSASAPMVTPPQPQQHPQPQPPVITKPKPNLPSGAVPVLPVIAKPKPSQPKCCALYDFKAEQSGDLEFVKGDMVLCTKMEGEWWEGRNVRTGKTGQFPSNYVQLIQ